MEERLPPQGQITDPALALAAATAEKEVRDRFLARVDTLSPREIFALGYATHAAIMGAYLEYKDNETTTETFDTDQPESSTRHHEPVKIGEASAATAIDMYDFAKEKLGYDEFQSSTVRRTWNALQRHRQSFDSSSNWGNYNAKIIYDHIEFFDIEAGVESGIEPGQYINLDKLYTMLDILFKQREHAPSQFRTSVKNFSIGSMDFLARFVNHYLQPEQPLPVPD